MRLALATLVVSLAVTSALVFPKKVEKHAQSKDVAASYNFAVDVSVAVSSYQFGRLKSSGYNTAFVRVYSPSGNGQVDGNARTNLQNAYSQGVGTEVYVQPAPNGFKSASSQFTDTYNALQGYGITIKAIWLKVSDPITWNSNQQTNINFINNFIQTAQRYGVTPGIFTNWYDWKQITSGVSNFSNVRLWYWNTLGEGAYAESYYDFTDFRAFGGWNSPIVKSYGLAEYKNGVLVNLISYPAGSAKAFGADAVPSLKLAAQKPGSVKKGMVVGDVFA